MERSLKKKSCVFIIAVIKLNAISIHHKNYKHLPHKLI